jgi:exopolyphosphatase/guanosine-5'-triphosphate,3'-diphosphate pyrophosphatase
MRILPASEEARLSFVGATRTMEAPTNGSIGVVDVGGGSTEVVVGTASAGVGWSRSLPIGSGRLADVCLRSDPPSVAELADARARVDESVAALEPPLVDCALAAGGSASSLGRIAGPRLDCDSLERCVRILSGAPAAELALRFELDPERIRLLPAGVLILDALSRRLGLALTVGNGGLREGLILELDSTPVQSKTAGDS